MVVGWKLGILRRRAAPRDAKKMGAQDADSEGIFPRSRTHQRGQPLSCRPNIPARSLAAAGGAVPGGPMGR